MIGTGDPELRAEGRTNRRSSRGGPADEARRAATSKRLAVAGLTAAEVDSRLQEIQALRRTLGEL